MANWIDKSYILLKEDIMMMIMIGALPGAGLTRKSLAKVNLS